MSARSIPLNIEDELSGRNLVGRLSVIVEGVPVRGALSAGTNNRDGTWSLNVGELAGLRFEPPENGDEARNLTVRILRYDEDGFDYASTVALFDIHVGAPDGAPRAEGPTATEIKQDAATQSAMDHWKAEVEQRLAQAEAAWEVESEERRATDKAAGEVEFEERLAADKAAWKVEFDERLAAGKAVWEAEEMQRLADVQSTWKAQEKEHLAAAKAAGDCELKQTLTEAKAAWRADDERYRKEAEEMWVRDEERRLGTAKQHWETETARRLRDADAAWRAGEDERLAEARKAWESEESSQRAQAEADWKVDQEYRLTALRETWEENLERHIAVAREAWETELEHRAAGAGTDSKTHGAGLPRLEPVFDAVECALTAASPSAPAEPLEPDAPAVFHDPEPEFYAQPDRMVLARHAIEEVKREAEERKLELAERKRRAKDAARGIADKRHRRTTLKARRMIGHFKPDIPWRKLALACSVIAGVIYLISSGGPNLTVFKNSLLSLRDRVADQKTQNVFFVRPARVNVRAQASTASAVIAQVVHATALLEIRRQEEWIQVTLPGGADKQGWVHASLLTSKPAANPLQ